MGVGPRCAPGGERGGASRRSLQCASIVGDRAGIWGRTGYPRSGWAPSVRPPAHGRTSRAETQEARQTCRPGRAGRIVNEVHRGRTLAVERAPRLLEGRGAGGARRLRSERQAASNSLRDPDNRSRLQRAERVSRPAGDRGREAQVRPLLVSRAANGSGGPARRLSRRASTARIHFAVRSFRCPIFLLGAYAAPQNPRSARTSGESRSFSKARSRIWRMRSRVTPRSSPIFSSVRASEPSSRP